MRDKLIELLNKFTFDNCEERTSESLAEYLVQNGVIVLPCKIGGSVYIINRANQVQEMKFDSMDLRCTCIRDDSCMCGSLCGDALHNICQYRFKNDFSDFGEKVFLSLEEAEMALKKLNGQVSNN